MSSRGPSRKTILRLLATVCIVLVVAATVHGLYQQKTPRLKMEQGIEAMAKGRYSKALEDFQQVYQQNPASQQAPKAMYHAGWVLHRHLKKYHQALLLFLTLEQSNPTSPYIDKALKETAYIYRWNLNDPGRAIDTYQRLIERLPDEAATFQYQIAAIYFQKRNYEQARIEFEEILQRWPNHPSVAEVIFRIARINELEGKEAVAEQGLRTILTEHPQSPFVIDARLALAGIYEKQGELTRALDQLNMLKLSDTSDTRVTQRIQDIRQRIQAMKAPFHEQNTD